MCHLLNVGIIMTAISQMLKSQILHIVYHHKCNYCLSVQPICKYGQYHDHLVSSRLMMMKMTISNYPDWADRIGGEGMAGHACNY